MTYQVHERWDEEHLVTPALEAVERYVKPGIPFSKAMVDDAQTAIDAVLGIVGRGDTERMMRRFFWFVRHFFNLYDQTPRTLPAHERVGMGVSFLGKAQRYLGILQDPHKYMEFFRPKSYAALMAKTEQERDLAVGKYHTSFFDRDVCVELGIFTETARNYDMFCRSFFLNTNHPTYRGLFFQDLGLMGKLRNS